MIELDQVFMPEGPLARELRGFRPRRAQVAMAKAAARTIDEGGCVVPDS